MRTSRNNFNTFCDWVKVQNTVIMLPINFTFSFQWSVNLRLLTCFYFMHVIIKCLLQKRWLRLGHVIPFLSCFILKTITLIVR